MLGRKSGRAQGPPVEPSCASWRDDPAGRAIGQAIRARYTDEVRNRGSMIRGGGGVGRVVRLFQTVARDGRRAQLAHELAPLEAEKQDIEAVVRAIDGVMIQLEAFVLKP